jgi:hypothetical protein
MADFTGFAAGESVEGMGVVAPNLNINAKGINPARGRISG